jgi:beta-phosphoglucomutase-like phosphatase (HAD superfamily)
MPLRALIFDVDGTLALTEREGHLPACNEAFASLGYPVRWSWEEFKVLLRIPGSAPRFRKALCGLNPPVPPEELAPSVAQLVDHKRRTYVDKFVPRLSLRPGVSELVAEAQARRVRLAVVSSSDEGQIAALLSRLLPGQDSQVGLQAAGTAGLPCAVFHNDYTFGESFAGAALVAGSFEGFRLDQLAALCATRDELEEEAHAPRATSVTAQRIVE